MKLLTAPAVNFIIVPPAPVPRIQLRRHMFWYQRTHQESQRHLLGSFVGHTVLDNTFHNKLERIRHLLSFCGIPWHETSYNLHEAELEASRRLDMMQKRQRKISKCWNVYNKMLADIENSAILFKTEALLELKEKLDATLKEIDYRYGNGYSRGTYLAQNTD